LASHHLSAKVISRGDGRSACAAAAYRHGEKIEDARQGLTFDFTRKRGVLHSELVMPASAEGWTPTRAALWNAAEKASGLAKAIIAREFEVALPHELSPELQKVLLLKFARFIANENNVACDVALHAAHRHGDQRNGHGHIMVTAKQIKGDRLTTKALGLDPISVQRMNGVDNAAERYQEIWATMTNEALAEAGIDARVDHRSFKDRGIDAEPMRHVGVAATAIDRKFARGEAAAPSERGAINDDIRARNAERAALKLEHAQITAEIIDLDAERQKREDAAAARDPGKLLDKLTRNNATFTRRELNRAAEKGFDNVKERSDFVAVILARAEIIPLREKGSDSVSRYTTRAVIEQEASALKDARTMAGDRAYSGITADGLRRTLADNAHLDAEQRAAVLHATGPGRFALIAGEAGTGKSTTFAAIREGLEADGYHVIGQSHTNKVVQAMRADGFDNAATVTGELMRLDNGRGDPWNSRTVIMVDEFAQLSTAQEAALFRHANRSGAKIIGAGDDKQFASIERGGLFNILKAEHGAAELHSIYRVKDADQKTAMNAMHKGDFTTGLGIFDRQGAIHWAKGQEESRAALIRQWADTAEPGKRQFIIAYTNREVDELNAAARAARKERGQLGEDVSLQTKDGPQTFATGDQIILTANARSKAQKEAGLFNNSMGTITAITEDKRGHVVTIRLDAKARDEKPRDVSFRIGEDAGAGEFNAIKHGYAGTIYKSQGDTIAQTYVLHSDQWRSAGGYVALTRQSERVTMFAAEQPSPWMMAQGGVSQLDAKQLASAEKSYAAWAEAKPNLAARHGFADYVGYVQVQWQEQKPMPRLDRMAAQMGRVEEKRAAHAFEQGFAPRPQETPAAILPDAFREAVDAQIVSRVPAIPELPAPASSAGQATPLSFTEQINARAAEIGAARGVAEADTAEITAIQNLLAELDAKAKSAEPGSKEQERALTQSGNVEADLQRMQGDDNDAEREAKQADWQQSFEAIRADALANAGSYEDKQDIHAEFSQIERTHAEEQDDDKGRSRTREPERGRGSR
jgi:Ti-type conjugative transfer relaxase TraA